MGCEQCEPYLNALADGELSPFARWRLRRHLHGCPTCTQAYAQIQKINRITVEWRDSTAQAPVPTALLIRITHQLAAIASPRAASDRRSDRRKERFMIPAFAVAATLLVAALIGITVPFVSSGGGRGHGGVAFAQVEDAVSRIKSAHVTFQMQGVAAYEVEVWVRDNPAAFVVLTPAHRVVGDNKGVTLYMGEMAPTRVTTIPMTREAIWKEILTPDVWIDKQKSDSPQSDSPHNWGDGTLVRDENGRQVLQFVSEEGPFRRTLWADTQTRLPVRVEGVIRTGGNPGNPGTSEESSVTTRFLMEYSFNETPPAGMFDHPIKEGKSPISATR